ncbi:MAG: sodium:panthothenate symporter [Kiritimatiellae bacterium]|nr:sodium:panthothenate symporter [Kiritimatiellia bacterium]
MQSGECNRRQSIAIEIIAMSAYHWLIIFLPFLFVCGVALRCRRYVRSVADFLVAGRCAGRYVMQSGSIMGPLSVMTLVATSEIQTQVGYGVQFWNSILMPLGVVLGLFGWIGYRFRETRAMSAGQFLEMRYSRSLRRFASVLRGIGEMLSVCIGPAIAARFFIYLLGLPHRFTVLGRTVETFPVLLAVLIAVALTMIFTGGRIALLVTDAVQALFSLPLLILLCGFVLWRFSWTQQIAPIMADHAAGESFLDPFDVSAVRDFNLFALFVVIFQRFFGGFWIGNNYGTVSRSPHEGKMSGIISNFSADVLWMLPVFCVLMVIGTMNHADFAPEAREVRLELASRITDEICPDAALSDAVRGHLAELPGNPHRLGVDPPLSRLQNPDTPYLAAAQETFRGELGQTGGDAVFGKFRALWSQLTLPLVLRRILPQWLLSLVVLLGLLMVVSTDDTRIFDLANNWTQDFVLTFLKEPPSPRTHLRIFKAVACLVGVCFWAGSCFLSQLDYISMFVSIAAALWTAGAGAVVTFGLYWRRGTTAGAWTALIAGGGLSGLGMAVQRGWASTVHPFLVVHGWDAAVRHALEAASAPFVPWIDWRVPDALWPVKFPINSGEIYFIAAATAVLLYVIVSLITCRKPFDMERMLHRDTREKKDCGATSTSFAKRFMAQLVNITPDYTRGDRIVTWVVFCYSIIYKFIIAFVMAAIVSRVRHWGAEQWGGYFFVVSVVVPAAVGLVTTVWFGIGTVRDLKRLFHDLENRVRDDADNGFVAK